MLNEAERATDADWAPYRERRRFNLFELACLLHRIAPERISNAVSAEVIAHDRALGYRPTMKTLEQLLVDIDARPETLLGDEIGGTLKALKTATAAPSMHKRVQIDRAQRLAATLGLLWPSELSRNEATESTEDRRKRRLARLRALGGNLRRAGDTWQLVGTRGALAQLVREEESSGRPLSKRQDVTRELRAAMAEQMQS